MHKDMHFNRIL